MLVSGHSTIAEGLPSGFLSKDPLSTFPTRRMTLETERRPLLLLTYALGSIHDD